MRVSLFIPCLVDELFPNAGMATLRVLERLGVEVVYPEGQTCCGQPAFNTGYRRVAARVARQFLKAFEDAEWIVAPSGSCVSMVKVFYRELDLPSHFKETAERISPRIYELTDFLVNVMKVEDAGSVFRHSVTYHDSCHLRRELRVIEPPRKLLTNVRGLTLVEMADVDRCCGFGGTFSVKFPELSTAMGDEKIRSVIETGAEYVTAGDVSCLMQIGGLLSRRRASTRAIHIAEILASES